MVWYLVKLSVLHFLEVLERTEVAIAYMATL